MRPWFPDWPALRQYCYQVAGTVGVMTLPVMGVAQGVTIEAATPAAGPALSFSHCLLMVY